MDISPDGSTLVCGTTDGTVHMFDIATGNVFFLFAAFKCNLNINKLRYCEHYIRESWGTVHFLGSIG